MVGIRRLTRGFGISLLAASFIACGGPAPESFADRADGGPGYPVVVKDDVGRKVEIASRPERLGSMAPSITETAFAVGAGDSVVGVTTADDYPAQTKKIKKIGDYREPNVEKVLALDIDVLFVSFDSATAGFAEDLEEKTKTDVVVLNPKTVDGAIESVGLVGKVVGERDEARALEGRLRRELNEVERAVAGRPEPTVFYEVWDDPLQTVGPGSFIHDAIEHAGGENVAAGTGKAYPSYSEETLLERDPDFYLVSETTPQEVGERPAYSSLAAVRRDRVSIVDADLIGRPGPRLVEGVRSIAESIHPNISIEAAA